MDTQTDGWLAAVLRSIADGVVASDEHACVVFMNRAAEELTGWTLDEARGKPTTDVLKLIDEATGRREAWPLRDALSTGRTVTIPDSTVLVSRSGRMFVISDVASPVLDGRGVTSGAVIVFRDVTETRRAEAAVRKSELRYRALARSTSDVVYRMSPDWAEMQPLDGRDLIPSADKPLREWMQTNVPGFEHHRVWAAIHDAIVGKRMFELEHQVNRPDGTLGWTYSRAVPILDDKGDIIEWLGAASDITARKRAEEERRRLANASERQRRIYEAALSTTPDLVYVFDLDHRFVYANEALLKMWGKTEEDALGKNCLELGYEPWHADMHGREIEQVVATRQPIRGEVPFTGTNGRRIYDYIFVPVIDSAGTVVAVAGTTRDVTERQANEQEIRKQAEQLRENDQRKDEFLAMLAHELRNPLAAVGNAVNVLRMSVEPEDVGFAKDVIERQTRQLSRLIDDLLDVSRIASGKIRLKRELCEARTILRQSVESVLPLMEERKHRFSVDLGDDALPLRADPTRVEQIAVNLLSNAAKYTESGGRIRLAARRHGDLIVITVEDNGMGIPPDKLPQMFELFAQGERTIARSEGGLGIGLTVVQKLAELHGGGVAAASPGPGKGSTFTVTLPAERAHAAESHEPESRRPSGRGSRILVVDDNVDTARGMARLLRLLGNEVKMVHDGTAAIAAARGLGPEFVLLDIGLPGMDGYEVARTLRAESTGKTAVIIAVSGYGQDEDRRRSREAGFDHHLVKPIDFDHLVALITQA